MIAKPSLLNNIIHFSGVALIAVLLIGCEDAPSKTLTPNTEATNIHGSFVGSDGSRLDFSADSWKNNKSITFSMDENGRPKFSSEFNPEASKAVLGSLNRIFEVGAPEILGRVLKESFDGAGRQINPINPALQGIEADDVRNVARLLAQLRQQASATPIQ